MRPLPRRAPKSPRPVVMLAEATMPGTPFAEAIAYLRGKTRIPTRHWTDLWQGMHARGFMVAGAMRDALIADLHGAVLKAVEDGETLDDFRRRFDAIVSQHGWSYRGGRRWRTRVIYDTNLRMAHSAGRWAQAMRVKDLRPWLLYQDAGDGRVRPLHHTWSGTVLRWDHPWWATHMPPNGWNCRCTIAALSDAELMARGLTPTAEAPEVTWEARLLNTPDGERIVQVPEGIDTGFAYNPGAAAWGHGEQALALERHGGWEPLEHPGGAPTRPEVVEPLPAVAPPPKAVEPKVVPVGDEAGLRSWWREAVGGEAATFMDPLGTPVTVTEAVPEHMIEDHKRWDGREQYWTLLSDLVEAPQEVWVGFVRSTTTGRVTVRRRYVKLYALDKTRSVALICDADNGTWSGLTFLRGTVSNLKRLRWGLRLWSDQGGQ